MKKLASYMASGKGMGLLIVLFMALTLGILVGLAYYNSLRLYQKQPATIDFVENFPTLEIKDGTIQGADVQWARMVPFTQIPLIIDTSKDDLENVPNVNNAFYVTKKGYYAIANKEVEHVVFADTFLLKNRTLPADYFLPISLKDVFSRSLGMFFATWMTYLVYVGVVALLAWIFRLSLAKKRVWRVVAVVNFIYLLVAMIFVVIPYTRVATLIFVSSTWQIILPILICLGILARLRHD